MQRTAQFTVCAMDEGARKHSYLLVAPDGESYAKVGFRTPYPTGLLFSSSFIRLAGSS
jgi:hypothetical protein